MVNSVLCFACYAAGTLLLCHFEPPHSLTRTEISAKSNHSRTSGKFARKSNYSRTYAKTGGVGVEYLYGNVPKKCRRDDIFYHATLFSASSFPPCTPCSHLCDLCVTGAS